MTKLSYYVALPFVLADDGTAVAGGPIECASAGTAILQAEVLLITACVFQKFRDTDFGNSRTAISIIPGQGFR